MNGNQQQQRGGHVRPQQGGQHRRQGNYSPVIGPKKEDVRQFIQDDAAAADMIKACEIFGGELKNNGVTTTQLRNAYGSMKKLEMVGWSEQTKTKVLLIKPRLAYAAGRHKKGMVDLSRVMADAIDAIRDEQDFQRFCNFFEAIVAYFKAAGGK